MKNLRVEVKCDVKDAWVLVSICTHETRAEEARAAAWKRGLAARIVRELPGGKKEVLL